MKSSKYITIASFDIGKKNFAQYIERYPLKELNKLRDRFSKLPKFKQRHVKGPMNDDVRSIQSRLFKKGKCMNIGVFDLTEGEIEGFLGVQTRRNLMAHLEEHSDIWEQVDIFVIEQQYYNPYRGTRRRGQTAGGANMDAIKLAEATFSYFLINHPFAEIQYFSSSYKTQILGAIDKMTKTQRKNWATVKFGELSRKKKDIYIAELYELAERVKRKRMTTEEKIQGFIDSYTAAIEEAGLPMREDAMYLAEKIVRERQKLDDISDAALQCHAFKYRSLVGCF